MLDIMTLNIICSYNPMTFLVFRAGKMETVCFRLPGHGDTTLKHMNSLRCRQHFCDITIMANNNQTFRGHKVVLAACSPFLRDQFLLNPSPKLQVNRNAGKSVIWSPQFRKKPALFLFNRFRCCTAPRWCAICCSRATRASCSSAPRKSSATWPPPATFRWSTSWSSAAERWRNTCSWRAAGHRRSAGRSMKTGAFPGQTPSRLFLCLCRWWRGRRAWADRWSSVEAFTPSHRLLPLRRPPCSCRPLRETSPANRLRAAFVTMTTVWTTLALRWLFNVCTVNPVARK